ncbi:MAG: carotenoid oxygenase family protein [Jaaginema sp. PMC 1079.18]|nr:carotenoid oxygenase family protein [Jaaginema sp. PMC 1080.18]MEC4849650.1 carotenoid oxygenase family protein [Jaaginema sp. PMC 1079.18]MEC4866090.1 carotenoid oxygenase family protein [Jaaginema sp. PMC 1078.18]
MQTSQPPKTHHYAWAGAIAHPAVEFPVTPLNLLSGQIPQNLRGTLYRNGPGCLQRGGEQVGHWFDGDGGILAVKFGEKGATATYQLVKTEGYLAEVKAGKFLFPNYGMKAPGFFWNNWLRPVKNVANTSVLALEDKLLALWEGGHPYTLDLETLETLGLDNLGGLASRQFYSAHPKIDPQTGEIFNFGVGITSQLYLYKSGANGTVKQKSAFKLPGLTLIHDFALAGRYLVFFVSPMRVNLIAAALGRKSYSDAMDWKPELGTQIFVFDKETLALVSRSTAEAWHQWHYANGYENEAGEIVVEMVAFPDFSTNQYLKEVARGKTKTYAKGTLWRVVLNPQTGKVISREQLCDRSCEFPVVPSSLTGQPWRYTYCCVHRENADIRREIVSAIARFDRETTTLTVADPGENRYCSEPIYVAKEAESGWLLTVVYDSNIHRSEVWIYDSETLSENPLCRLELPQTVPLSFHGTFSPDPR